MSHGLFKWCLYYLSGPWTCQYPCCLCRVRKLSDWIKNILIYIPLLFICQFFILLNLYILYLAQLPYKVIYLSDIIVHFILFNISLKSNLHWIKYDFSFQIVSKLSPQTITAPVSHPTRRSASLQIARPPSRPHPPLTRPTPQTRPWVSWRPLPPRWPRAPTPLLSSTKNPPTLPKPLHTPPKTANVTAAPRAATPTRTLVRPARLHLKSIPLPQSPCCSTEELGKGSRWRSVKLKASRWSSSFPQKRRVKV